MNQFHTHSQKKQNPAKKFIKFGQIEIARQRRRWDWRRDRAVRCCDRRAAWFCDRQLMRCCDQRLARRDRRIGAQFMVISEVASSSLFAIWALSLSLSGNTLKWKWELNSFFTSEALFYGQTENIFSLTQFTGPTKHATFRKMIFEFRLKSKQTDPKKKNIVNRSFAKAEYRSMAVAVCEILWILSLLRDIQVDHSKAALLFSVS